MIFKDKTNYTNHRIYDGKITNLTPMTDRTKSFNSMQAVMPYNRYMFNGILNRQEYDFTETYRIIDTESYVASVFRKKKTLLLKDGYNLISENEKDKKYIEKRLEELSYVTGKTFKNILTEFSSSLINNHNSYLLIVRDSQRSSGNSRNYLNKNVEPIAGIFVIPETKIKPIEDLYGLVINYRYEVKPGFYEYFTPEEIIHLSLEKKPGSNIGTPPLESVVDDLRALRQVEESLERLIYKLSTPIIHAKVGTPERPASFNKISGEEEVKEVSEALTHLEESGGITTNERVEFKILGAESQALRLGGYLDYFKNRVLIGLTCSDIDLGVANSTSSAAAQELKKALAQNVEMYQQAIENEITDRLFCLLLLESDKYSDKFYIEERDKVKLKFINSDIDAKIKTESHYINEVNAGLITVDEYRALTGKRQLSNKEKTNLKGYEDLSQTETNGSTDSIANPVNQHTDETVVESRVQDSLNIKRYIELLNEDAPSASLVLLNNTVTKELDESKLEYNKEEFKEFITRLTTSMQQFIIGKVPQDSVYPIVNKMLYRKITEIIEENS